MILEIFTIPIKFTNTKEYLNDFLVKSFEQSGETFELEYIANNNIGIDLFNKKNEIHKVGNFFISNTEVLINISNIGKLFFSYETKIVYYQLNNDEINTFVNEVLLCTLILFQKSILLIHGSCMHYKNNTNIFTGWGGSGKTSLSSALYQRFQGKFISDDITVLGNNHRVFHNPSLLNIHDYNIKESTYFSKINIKDNYDVYNIDDIYKNISNNDSVNKIFFLQKQITSQFKIGKISNKEINNCSKMLYEIILHELKVLHYLKKSLDASELFLGNCIFIESFTNYSKKLVAFLESVEMYYIKLPYDLTSNKLNDFILDEMQ